MPGSASVESLRLTRRPSRADSRSDDGRSCWRHPMLSLTWLLCCIKTTSDDSEEHAENDSNSEDETTSQKSNEIGNMCGENDHPEPNNNEGGEWNYQYNSNILGDKSLEYNTY